MLIVVHGAEVYPKMPRKWSKAIPKGNSPVPRDEVGPDQPTITDFYRMVEEFPDKSNRNMDELTEERRWIRQHSAHLEQEAQQPRLAMEEDVKSDTKTRKRSMEGTTVDQAKHKDSCSAESVQVGPTSSINFGMKAEPPALPRRDGVLVNRGAAAPQSCLSPVEIRTLTAAGDLLPAAKRGDEDHIIPAASLVLPDQRDKF